MNELDFIPETSKEILQWIESVRRCIVPWHEPGMNDQSNLGPVFFDTECLTARDLVVVPFIDRWVPNDSSVVDNVYIPKYPRLYAWSFEFPEDPVMSCRPDAKSIRNVFIELNGNCVILSRDETIMVINTTLDYWLLAGSYSTVRAACESTLQKAFQRFQEEASEDVKCFDAGQNFARFICETYMVHNRKVIDKIPLSALVGGDSIGAFPETSNKTK